MTSLTAAHRGYEYQDLLVAFRLVDMLLGSVVQVHVDEKLTVNDRFDDLSTIDIDGRRERTQFKHTENADRPLSLATFTTDARGLRLDFVIASILADRSGPGRDATSFSYRIVLRDSAPVDPALTAILIPLAEDDPGPFISGSGTLRFQFDAAALWSKRNGPATGGTFGFLADYETLTLDDLKWACKHLVVEIGAPPASADLTAPDIAEHLLLNRMRAEVGAEALLKAAEAEYDRLAPFGFISGWFADKDEERKIDAARGLRDRLRSERDIAEKDHRTKMETIQTCAEPFLRNAMSPEGLAVLLSSSPIKSTLREALNRFSDELTTIWTTHTNAQSASLEEVRSATTELLAIYERHDVKQSTPLVGVKHAGTAD